MSLVTGATFAGYRVLRRLGSGGMAEVYLVQHPRLPRQEALKILAPALSADDEFRRRFHREADLAATLWHPNIVEVHDRGEHDGRLWITMDYVDGTDAAELVRTHYPTGMPAPDVCLILTGVADALDYAHHQGLLHRDVKPANILLAHPGSARQRVLLADFGIARQVGDPRLTATNIMVGTLGYAAPRQLGGGDIDGRADQYSLAATVFHLLTGVPPFPLVDPIAAISAHLTAPRPSISDHRPDLAALDPVLHKALSIDPAARYTSCGEFAGAVLAGLTPAPPPHSTPPPVPPAPRSLTGAAAPAAAGSTVRRVLGPHLRVLTAMLAAICGWVGFTELVHGQLAESLITFVIGGGVGYVAVAKPLRDRRSQLASYHRALSARADAGNAAYLAGDPAAFAVPPDPPAPPRLRRDVVVSAALAAVFVLIGIASDISAGLPAP